MRETKLRFLDAEWQTWLNFFLSEKDWLIYSRFITMRETHKVWNMLWRSFGMWKKISIMNWMAIFRGSTGYTFGLIWWTDSGSWRVKELKLPSSTIFSFLFWIIFPTQSTTPLISWKIFQQSTNKYTSNTL